MGYTASDVKWINDATGNLLGSTDTPIAVNLIKDTDAPTIKSAKADGGTKAVVLEFSEKVSGAPDASDFTV